MLESGEPWIIHKQSRLRIAQHLLAEKQIKGLTHYQERPCESWVVEKSSYRCSRGTLFWLKRYQVLPGTQYKQQPRAAGPGISSRCSDGTPWKTPSYQGFITVNVT